MLPSSSFKSQSGYIIATLIIFVFILSILIFPKKFPEKNKKACQIGEAPDSIEILSDLPAIKDLYLVPDPKSGNDPDQGGPDPEEKADYVLVRKNVFISEKTWPEGWVFLGGPEATSNSHMINLGEMPQKKGYNLYIPSKWGEMDPPGYGRLYVRNLGLLFFTNNDPGTQRVDKTGGKIYLSEIYQDKRIFDDPNKKYKTEELFFCDPKYYDYTNKVVIPDQSESPDNKQLQLEWFQFEADVWGIHCKPAIYLYPNKKTLVNVKVNSKGILTYTDPKYPEDIGWTIQAHPNGDIISLDHNHKDSNGSLNYINGVFPYLYYESKVPDQLINIPTKGYVVKYEDLESLYKELLPKLGLNNTHIKDFTEYWNKALPKSPYYFVGILDQDNINSIEPLTITPKPDSVNRVRIYFERLNEYKAVEEPDLSHYSQFSIPDSQFKVIEWGGMVKRDSASPFTCSE